jgi:transcriptional regulator with XRE-family HTH domain
MSLPHTKHRYRDRAGRLRLADRFHSSGLTQAEFCEQQQISRSTLVRWLAEAREDSAKRALPARFEEVRLPGPLFPPASALWALEATGVDGVTLRFREMPPIEDLARLLRAGAC